MTTYDIIGDIHGEAGKLRGLLNTLGYKPDANGVFRHETNTAVFVGDFIDRGSQQWEVYQIVRPMVEQGAALAVAGNHEYNAIGYATLHPDGTDYLRPHDGQWGPKNLKQHEEFLRQIPFGTPEHREIIAWFTTLPLFLELDDLRVVHACWHQPSIDALKAAGLAGGLTTLEMIYAAYDVFGTNPALNAAVEMVLKGPEIPVGEYGGFYDKDGNYRTDARLRWWLSGETRLRELADIPLSKQGELQLPDIELDLDPSLLYPAAAQPVFFGHYWRTGEPVLIGARAVCVDYSAARKNEPLVAYRYRAGDELAQSNFVSFCAV